MAQHTWKSLHKVIFVFLGMFSLAIFVPVTIAIINGDVTPYVPYISEGGGDFPQAGIFTTLVVISCIFSETIMIFRYLVVDERCSDNKTHLLLNKLALVIGTLSTISFVMVGAFPTTIVTHVHNVVAGTTTISTVIYMFFQTWISLQSYSESRMKKLRLAILIFSFISLATMGVFGGLGAAYWTAKHWPGRKVPQDKGFVFYLVSATCEWILAALFFFFCATYYHDFKGSTLHFQLQTAPKSQARPHLVPIKVGI